MNDGYTSLNRLIKGKDELIKALTFALEDLRQCERYILSQLPEGIAKTQVKSCFKRVKEVLGK